MFTDFLSKRLTKNIQKNLKKSTLNVDNLETTFKEIRSDLIEADVNLNVVKDFINNIRKQAQDQLIIEGVKADQMLIKIVHDELKLIMGNHVHELNLNKRPTVIMMVGLQGSGKTTTTAKLAKLINSQFHKKSLLVAADVYRLAAVEQLRKLGQDNNLDVYFEENQKDVLEIAQNALQYAVNNKYDVMIVDTAGRLHLDDVLMTELKDLKKTIHPQEIIIVVDAMSGQEIINVTQSFNADLKLTGTILTKLDGDARGGAALSISYLTKLPIMFAGVGESIDELEVFYPERMADRILGKGDVVSLVEKAQKVFDTRTMEKTMNRIMMGRFDLDDLANQMKQMQKMGKLSGIMKLVPGAGKISEEKIEGAENKLKVIGALLDSMTLKERREPKLLKSVKRQNRIIKGSGRTLKEFNQMLNQFEKAKKNVDEIARNFKMGRMPNFGNLGGFNK